MLTLANLRVPALAFSFIYPLAAQVAYGVLVLSIMSQCLFSGHITFRLTVMWLHVIYYTLKCRPSRCHFTGRGTFAMLSVNSATEKS